MSSITKQDRAIYKIMKGGELCDSDFKTSWSIYNLKLEIWKFMAIMLDRMMFIDMRKRNKDSRIVPENNSYKGSEVFSSDLLKQNYMLKRYKDSWYIDIEDEDLSETNKTIDNIESLDSSGFIKIRKRKYDIFGTSRWHIEFDIDKLETYRNYFKLVLEEK